MGTHCWDRWVAFAPRRLLDLKIVMSNSGFVRILRHLLAIRSAPRHLCGFSVCRKRNGAGVSKCRDVVEEGRGGDAEYAEGFPGSIFGGGVDEEGQC